MRTKDYKGTPGGDPSRRPALSRNSIPCKRCGTSVEFMSNGKNTPSLFCSDKCKNEIRKEETIKSLHKYGIKLTINKNRSFTSLTSLLQVCEMVALVSKGKKIYESGQLHCSTCKEGFSYFSLDPIRQPRLYCSSVCHKNRNKLPGSSVESTLCPRPEKMKFSSLEEADLHLQTLMDDDIARNNDLQSYVCPCGHVHFGSIEKSIFEAEDRELIEKKKKELQALLVKSPHLKVKTKIK